MKELWLSLAKIPAEGREFSFSDQSIWTEQIEEFGLPFTIIDPIEAVLHVTPQKDGCLITGRLTGSVQTPCGRCAEPTTVSMDERFEVFEQLDDEDRTGPGLLRRNGDFLELNVAGLLWEQLVLVLPSKPLCSEGCKGLCPTCGANLNQDPCQCENEQGDPRLAVLKNVKITPK